MSLVTSSFAAGQSSTCSAANYNNYPTTDVFCAVASTEGLPSNYSDILGGCCKDAPVEKYARWLRALLPRGGPDGGVRPQLILCNGNNTATATGKPASTGAAPGYLVTYSVSKAGLGMLAMLFVSAAVGTLL
ncbi:hypothetical protein K505DRAFT_405064 [Melanomma pulvis-pyrius CBS 109.77]|uniref:Uncharacterized protein n=1 Tax=Melanomma pulvis-pyrius CBS 109.77 TaxID=1314802 RepID=A0A6A6XQM4_9PLEO|nr:hypothetical protein K505DRAFT_405064 [Melanomma pulvis-pyrius CBS 109.77]